MMQVWTGWGSLTLTVLVTGTREGDWVHTCLGVRGHVTSRHVTSRDCH